MTETIHLPLFNSPGLKHDCTNDPKCSEKRVCLEIYLGTILRGRLGFTKFYVAKATDFDKQVF